MISLSHLKKSYGDFLAVEDLCLEVGKGEFFAFLGPNGAGKTTTIKMMTGMLRPDSGEVEIDGISLEKEPLQAKSKLGFVPDTSVFYEKLTCLEFMDFIADIYGLPMEAARKETEALFERFALTEYQHQLLDELSHGTRQRMAISAALLHEPEVFVIDEPMVGLDPIHAAVVKSTLRERCDAGMTVFMSTHLLSMAEELADRIGVMHRGKLIALGTAAELKKEEGRGMEEVFLELVGNS